MCPLPLTHADRLRGNHSGEEAVVDICIGVLLVCVIVVAVMALREGVGPALFVLIVGVVCIMALMGLMRGCSPDAESDETTEEWEQILEENPEWR